MYLKICAVGPDPGRGQLLTRAQPRESRERARTSSALLHSGVPSLSSSASTAASHLATKSANSALVQLSISSVSAADVLSSVPEGETVCWAAKSQAWL